MYNVHQSVEPQWTVHIDEILLKFSSCIVSCQTHEFSWFGNDMGELNRTLKTTFSAKDRVSTAKAKLSCKCGALDKVVELLL